MKTISRMIRETGLPDADAMADWLEREHPGLGEKYKTPSSAVVGGITWRQTPFGFAKWGKVYGALCRAEAAAKEQGQ